MLPLAGKPMLWHIVERVKRSRLADRVIVAVPDCDTEFFQSPHGLDLVEFIAPFQGPGDEYCSENDLVLRYLCAASMCHADVIVRICADNPFVEPEEIDRLIKFSRDNPDLKDDTLFTNMMQYDEKCGYPNGIGAEVYSFNMLEKTQIILQDRTLDEQRRQYLKEHIHANWIDYDLYKQPQCPTEFARPDLRLDVNHLTDYEFVKDIYDHLYPNNPEFHITDVINYLEGKKVVR